MSQQHFNLQFTCECILNYFLLADQHDQEVQQDMVLPSIWSLMNSPLCSKIKIYF